MPPFLKIGVTDAIFQEEGIKPSLKDESKMWHRGVQRLAAQDFSKMLGMPSRSVLQDGLRLMSLE